MEHLAVPEPILESTVRNVWLALSGALRALRQN